MAILRDKNNDPTIPEIHWNTLEGLTEDFVKKPLNRVFRAYDFSLGDETGLNIIGCRDTSGKLLIQVHPIKGEICYVRVAENVSRILCQTLHFQGVDSNGKLYLTSPEADYEINLR